MKKINMNRKIVVTTMLLATVNLFSKTVNTELIGRWFCGEEKLVKTGALMSDKKDVLEIIKCNVCPYVTFKKDGTGIILSPNETNTSFGWVVNSDTLEIRGNEDFLGYKEPCKFIVDIHTVNHYKTLELEFIENQSIKSIQILRRSNITLCHDNDSIGYVSSDALSGYLLKTDKLDYLFRSVIQQLMKDLYSHTDAKDSLYMLEGYWGMDDTLHAIHVKNDIFHRISNTRIGKDVFQLSMNKRGRNFLILNPPIRENDSMYIDAQLFFIDFDSGDGCKIYLSKSLRFHYKWNKKKYVYCGKKYIR